MNLVLERRVFDTMVKAARKAAPLEACGLCAGNDGHVTHGYEMTNADLSSEHYRMLPEEQFAAVKDMRAKGIDMLAIWHSHPATPARLSDEDLRLAYTPKTVYLVVSLALPDAPEIRGFTVCDDKPAEVELVMVDSREALAKPRGRHEPENRL